MLWDESPLPRVLCSVLHAGEPIYAGFGRRGVTKIGFKQQEAAEQPMVPYNRASDRCNRKDSL